MNRPPVARRVMVFTRYPEPGRSKTRLIPALGPDGAATLHRQLAERTLDGIRRFDGAVEVWYTGAGEPTMRQWLGAALDLRAQCDGDLGARMAHAFDAAFATGTGQALIVGSDCPDLGPETYVAALDALARHDVALGPALDGGYYLIGLRREAWPRARGLFDEIAWSTDTVLQETLDRAHTSGLSVAHTATLADVDEPADIEFWSRAQSGPGAKPLISIIVPTRNAGDLLESTLRSIGNSPEVELIVVDAGSDDGTVERASSFGARVVASPPGRARQMNRASAYAAGDVLLFLHSDTVLPQGYVEEIRRILSRTGVVAGAFRFATDYRNVAMRVVEWSTNLRARWLQLPYGDQGIFVRTSDFRRLGGFHEWPIMDDFDFIVRARKLGRIAIADSAAVTSGARWKNLGILRTMLRNQIVVALYYGGVPPDRLAELYRRGTTY